MIILKPIIAFLLLLILARILGKKQMSQMTFFNYVTGITIGSLAANMITFNDDSIIEEVIGLVIWCALTALLSFITLKSSNIRKVIDGKPSFLIKKGKLQEKEMKLNRISLEELSMMLREQGIFSITEVDYAILEPNGKLSILKIQEQTNVTRKDMSIPNSNLQYLPAEVVIDGRIVEKNLKSYGLNIQWLENELRHQKIKSVKDIFYAEIQSDGTLYTMLKK